jgi:hypothetical protein
VLERQTILRKKADRRIPSRQNPKKRPGLAGSLKKNLPKAKIGIPEDYFKAEAKKEAWLCRVG